MGCFLFSDIILELISYQSISQKKKNPINPSEISSRAFPKEESKQSKVSLLKSHPDRFSRRFFIYILIIIYILKVIEILLHFSIQIIQIHSSNSLNQLKS